MTVLKAATGGRLAALALTAVTASVLGCGENRLPDPQGLPYRLEESRRFDHPFVAADLDGDGKDETVAYYQYQAQHGGSGVVLLRSQSGFTIEQLNYPGLVQRPFFRDIDGDGRPEILVPLVRNDSLFVSFATGRGEKLFHFFLATGEPRREPEGSLPWDPAIVDFHITDADQDGQPDLVTVLNTRLSRLPRGVFVHRLPDGKLLGRQIIGASSWQSMLDDFDEDGRFELLVSTWAPNNGATAGGFDDSHSYLILFEFTPAPEVTRAREMGDKWWTTHLGRGDFDGEGPEELLVATTSRGRESGERARLEIIDAGTWRPMKRFSSTEPLSSPVVIDRDLDARPEIVLVRYPAELWVLDADLRWIERKSFAPIHVGQGALRGFQDVDGDGVDDLHLALTEGFLLIGGDDLRVIVRHSEGYLRAVLRRGIGDIPAFVSIRGEDRRVLDLVENPWHWVHRFARPALWILAVTGTFAGVWWLARQRRRRRLLEAVHGRQFESASAGLLLLDRHGRVCWLNGTLRRWLELEEGRRKTPSDLDAVAERSPELGAFCQEALTTEPPEPQSRSTPVSLSDTRRPTRLAAQPLIAGVRGDPHWLVRVSDRWEAVTPDASRTWTMMAQRVAHSVKNPLTSILLTLQRLQMEYRERAPAVANRLDPYSTRIEGRIEELRQLTSNFLKFVDLEAPELTEQDLNRLVEEFSERRRRSMPPDIRLDLKLERDLPRTRVDREQIHSLFDNLVTNAINAMPEGGVITISTALASGVQLPKDPAPRDYVEVEVMDTGKGISPDVRERLFEPGYTDEAGGSGLGLAIVRKIVRDHGGEITVESEPGTGSAFSVHLPTHAAFETAGAK